MDAGWAAIVGAVIAGVVGLVTVLASRAEPRALKELKTLNEVIEATQKSSDARTHLEKRRDYVAEQYGAHPLPYEAKAVLWLGSIGVLLLAVAFVLFIFVSQPADVLAKTGPTISVFLVGATGAILFGAALASVVMLLLAALGVRLINHWRRGKVAGTVEDRAAST